MNKTKADQQDFRYACLIAAIMVMICIFSALLSLTWTYVFNSQHAEKLIHGVGEIIPRVKAEEFSISLMQQSDSLRLYVALSNFGCMFAWVCFIPVAWNQAKALDSEVEPQNRWMRAQSFTTWPAVMLVFIGLVFFSANLSDGASDVSKKFIKGYGYTFWPILCFSALSIGTFRMFVSYRQSLKLSQKKIF